MTSLRRSQRGRGVSFAVGDAVELVRNDGTFTGTLLRKTADSSPSNPRWIVVLTDGRRKNEEVPEKSLRKISDDRSAQRKTSRKLSRDVKPKRGTGASGRASRSKDTSPSSSSSSSDMSGTKESPSKSGSRDVAISGKKRTAAVEEGDSNTKQSKSVSFQDHSRQARKKLRTARINTRASARNDPHGEALVAPMEVKPARRGGRKGGARPKAKKNEEVVKVKMLTGTLYLYKGETRRAEFVRFY